ncbi:MAG: hypothetical protein GC136_00740 [Alphaproteobacteria bacterium]|nr:hypothetical protein [Alphaproteobacteria bacterium]
MLKILAVLAVLLFPLSSLAICDDPGDTSFSCLNEDYRRPGEGPYFDNLMKAEKVRAMQSELEDYREQEREKEIDDFMARIKANEAKREENERSFDGEPRDSTFADDGPPQW